MNNNKWANDDGSNEYSGMGHQPEYIAPLDLTPPVLFDTTPTVCTTDFSKPVYDWGSSDWTTYFPIFDMGSTGGTACVESDKSTGIFKKIGNIGKSAATPQNAKSLLSLVQGLITPQSSTSSGASTSGGAASKPANSGTTTPDKNNTALYVTLAVGSVVLLTSIIVLATRPSAAPIIVKK